MLRLTAKISSTIYAALTALIMIGCSGREKMPEGAVYSCDEFTLWPDSLVIDGKEIILSPSSPPSGDTLSLESDFSLLTALFNRAVRDYYSSAAGNTSDKTETDVIPAYRIPDPLINPDGAKLIATQLLDSLKGEWVDGKQYPVVQTRSRSLAAIIDVINVTGDNKLRERLADAAIDMLDNDFAIGLDKSTRLFAGIDPDALLSGELPEWFNAADCAAAISYRTNIDHLKLIKFVVNASRLPAERIEYLTAFSDTLANAIDTYFWEPSAGYFSRLLYAPPFPIQLAGCDLAAMADAITATDENTEIASAAVRSTPLYPSRLQQFYPPTPVNPVSSPQVEARWSAAASSTGNVSVLSASLAMLTARSAIQAEADNQAIMSGVMRGLFGIDTSSPDKLAFHPCIPQLWAGRWQLNNLRYRNLNLTVELQGHGTIISTFAIDGEPTDDYFIPASLEGDHRVTITLVGTPADPPAINFATAHSLPPPPSVKWTSSPPTAHIDRADNASVLLLVNGAIQEEVEKATYSLPSSDVTMTASFVSIENGVAGFSSRPLIYCADSIEISVTDFVHPWSRSLRDKDLARTHVETTRYRNRSLTFEVDLVNSADYYLSITYLNGEGIVNPDRRYSLRLLSVNATHPVLIVFPQLTPDDWRYDADWQRLTARTIPAPISLNRGRNTLRLEYFTPDLEEFNHDTNTLIPTAIILYPR